MLGYAVQGQRDNLQAAVQSCGKVRFIRWHSELYVATGLVDEMPEYCARYDICTRESASVDGCPDGLEAAILLELLRGLLAGYHAYVGAH